MNASAIPQVIARQREFFATHATRPLAFRLRALERLEEVVRAHEGRIAEAMHKDYRKSAFEAYVTEIGMVLDEIRYHRRHLKGWMKPECAWPGLFNLPATARIVREPFGVSLVMAPWNYPFLLLMNPLVGSISAGNCVVAKPADYSLHTSEAIAAMLGEAFPPEHIAVFTGGRSVIQELLEERYDHICFTGSASLGRVVMEKASRHLTPVVLELGGKSPCIVDADADIELAARRIAWGKFLNAGQTCVAPDYLLVHRAVKEPLLAALKRAITRMYGEDPRQSPDFQRIINDKQMAHMKRMLERGTALCGGVVDEAERYVAPTILEGVSPDDPVMQEEIFGPVLPVQTFDQLDEAIAFVNARPKPLALYFFSGNRASQRRMIGLTSSGGACINETVMHLASPHLPFGGVGESGMGGYHGKYSFDAFSHRRSVLDKATWLDLPLRYAPYKGKLGLVKKLLG